MVFLRFLTCFLSNSELLTCNRTFKDRGLPWPPLYLALSGFPLSKYNRQISPAKSWTTFQNPILTRSENKIWHNFLKFHFDFSVITCSWICCRVAQSPKANWQSLPVIFSQILLHEMRSHQSLDPSTGQTGICPGCKDHSSVLFSLPTPTGTQLLCS